MNEIVMSHEEILEACKRLGKELSDVLREDDKPPVFVCVLKGAMNFMADLIENIDIPIFTDYIRITSYIGDHTSGKATLHTDITTPLEGRTLVIVEDIIDTGIAMKFLTDHFKAKNPKRVISVALLDKTTGRKIDIDADYVGKKLYENKFVLGYGLDYKELHRNDPYVFVPTKDEVAELDALADK